MRASQAREILGVTSQASEADLRRRYLHLAKKLHPDVGGQADDFVDLQRAFEVLAKEPAPAASSSPSWGSATPSPKTVEAQRHVAERRAASAPAAPSVDPIDLGATAAVAPSSWSSGETLTRLSLARAIVASPILRLRSRGPKGAGGRLTNLLDDSLSTVITIDTSARPVGLVSISGQKRSARSLLLAGSLPAGWVAHRTSSDVVVAKRSVAQMDDPLENAMRHALVVEQALDAISWPLAAWRVILSPGTKTTRS